MKPRPPERAAAPTSLETRTAALVATYRRLEDRVEAAFLFEPALSLGGVVGARIAVLNAMGQLKQRSEAHRQGLHGVTREMVVADVDALDAAIGRLWVALPPSADEVDR